METKLPPKKMSPATKRELIKMAEYEIVEATTRIRLLEQRFDNTHIKKLLLDADQTRTNLELGDARDAKAKRVRRLDCLKKL